MKLSFIYLCLTTFLCTVSNAQNALVSSPNKDLTVDVRLNELGSAYYSVSYKGETILEESPLGLVTDVSDFSRDLALVQSKNSVVNTTYRENKIKHSEISSVANELIVTYETPRKEQIEIVFRVSNHDIAIKYILPRNGEAASCVIQKELTGFNFPQFTTTFLSPQASPMIGWKRTKPSYEEEYTYDEPVGVPSKYGVGYTFPGLFRIGDKGWALVSETGVSSLYCGSKLSEGNKDGIYTIAFPEVGENNGVGSAQPAISLPGETPWRTITVGSDLKPIVETTVAFDVVSPLYEPSIDYKMGRGTWSWIMWQDDSMNYKDQVAYIDLAAKLGYEYILIDAFWDTRIGYDKMSELIEYAQSKGVDVFLWYNSAGFWNNTLQGPKNRMDNSVARKAEMKWLKDNGVKGLKVDFFGGDKQETMKLYEDILVDANENELMIIFHGCTLPRGWVRMYPNYVGSEAVLASENLIFTQHANDKEAYNATLHPFIRNAVGSREFGPVLLNKLHNRNNDGGCVRKTTETFQIATAVLYQNPVQMFAVAPNNLDEMPPFVIDFIKEVPTTWDETIFIDGYPGKYCVLARRNNEKWYVVAVNAEKKTRTLEVSLPMIDYNQQLLMYFDNESRQPQTRNIKMGKNKKTSLTIQPEGAVILVTQ